MSRFYHEAPPGLTQKRGMVVARAVREHLSPGGAPLRVAFPRDIRPDRGTERADFLGVERAGLLGRGCSRYLHFTLTEIVPMLHAHVLTGRALATAAMTLLVLGGCLVWGCASTTVQAQWTDPSFAGQSLRGATVLVVCDASDAALTRLCKDHLAGQVAAAGAKPSVAPAGD